MKFVYNILIAFKLFNRVVIGIALYAEKTKIRESSAWRLVSSPSTAVCAAITAALTKVPTDGVVPLASFPSDILDEPNRLKPTINRLTRYI